MITDYIMKSAVNKQTCFKLAILIEKAKGKKIHSFKYLIVLFLSVFVNIIKVVWHTVAFLERKILIRENQ